MKDEGGGFTRRRGGAEARRRGGAEGERLGLEGFLSPRRLVGARFLGVCVGRLRRAWFPASPR
jgi:hypothetical protein